jgi:pseudaminic acid synthase
MRIADFELNKQTLIIAELSANHGQDFQIAAETIRAAKKAGADAIKLQTYTADSLTIDCNNPCFTGILKGTIWEGRTLYNLYQEAFTPWEWHAELFRIAKEEGLLCFSTPFDRKAVDFLEPFDPPAYKIASFEIRDTGLIEYAASKGKPMIISTGIADEEDIELALECCRKVGNHNIILLKCTSAYPAPVEEANLLTIPDMKKRFGTEAGLSDHTPGIALPVAAVALGARVIEKHFILDKSIGGPDASFSLDPEEFGLMVQSVRDAEKALGKVTYQLSEKMKAGRIFGRSLFAVEEIEAGALFTSGNIRSIRPGLGLHPMYLNEIIGKRASRHIERGTPLDFGMVMD